MPPEMRHARWRAGVYAKPFLRTSNVRHKVRRERAASKLAAARVHIVPTIARATASLITIRCGVCGREHTYLRDARVLPQLCPWEPESGVVLHIVLPPDGEAAGIAVAA